MQKLEKYLSQYRSYYAAGKGTGVNAQQLKRLVDNGALVDAEGGVWIKSKTKILNLTKKKNDEV